MTTINALIACLLAVIFSVITTICVMMRERKVSLVEVIEILEESSTDVEEQIKTMDFVDWSISVNIYKVAIIKRILGK